MIPWELFIIKLNWKKIMVDKFKLPEFDGKSAYSGAIRFYDHSSYNWEQEWGYLYGSLKPNFNLFAIDVFGTAYGTLLDGNVAIFWSETGELESIEATQNEFFEMILEDPNATLNYDFYLSAIKTLSKPNYNEHFAFKIEISLGGSMSIDNLIIMESSKHFLAMANIAKQINDLPIGSVINNISYE